MCESDVGQDVLMSRSTWMCESDVGHGCPYVAEHMYTRERRLNDLGLLSANARKADTRATLQE